MSEDLQPGHQVSYPEVREKSRLLPLALEFDHELSDLKQEREGLESLIHRYPSVDSIRELLKESYRPHTVSADKTFSMEMTEKFKQLLTSRIEELNEILPARIKIVNGETLTPEEAQLIPEKYHCFVQVEDLQAVS